MSKRLGGIKGCKYKTFSSVALSCPPKITSLRKTGEHDLEFELVGIREEISGRAVDQGVQASVRLHRELYGALRALS